MLWKISNLSSRLFLFFKKRLSKSARRNKYTYELIKRCQMLRPRRLLGLCANLPQHCKSIVLRIQHLLGVMSRARIITQILGYASNVVLLIALAIGLYTRWHYTEDVSILLFGFAGLFVFSISAALVYYFSIINLGYSLSRLYIGCILGVIAFTEHSTFHGEVTEEAMNILLITSLLMRFYWSTVERILGINTNVHVIFDKFDAMETLGVLIAALVAGKEAIAVAFLLVSLMITITSIRLKSYLGLINFVFIIIISRVLYFPKLLQLTANPFAFACYAGRMCYEPIIDLYFSRLTTLERWQPLFFKHPIKRKLLIIFVFSLQIAYLVVNAKQIPTHKEWFVVVPLFTAFGFIWLCYHVVFTVTCWQLSNKITICNSTYNNLSEQGTNLNQIMASKGVRHFSLISKRLVLVTLVTTVIIGAIGWNTKTVLSISLLCMVIPIESAVMSLLWEMGSVLGGTCVGYAIVAPALTVKADQPVRILHETALQELGSRATHILNTVQRFFSKHLIEPYGCDYSSSGLGLDALKAKLSAFFGRRTSDGPAYDTYLLYYSGSVYENGDWALAENNVFKLADLMEVWDSSIASSGSRLILVLDTDSSHRWVRDIRKLRNHHVALQTCQIRRISNDIEDGMKIGIGSFTTEWVDFNEGKEAEVDVHNKDRPIKMMYSVSKSWMEFTFHLPTADDIVSHWNSSFPKFTRPLIKVTNFPKSWPCCFLGLVSCLRRWRMTWFPPAEFNTGHGYKLVNT